MHAAKGFCMFSKISELLNRQDTLEKKLFWGLTIIMSVISLISFILTLVQFLSKQIAVSALIMAGVCFVMPILIMIVCKKTQAYSICYTAMAIIMSAVLLPITFFAGGGLISGMPIYCLGGVTICGFCMKKKSRFIAYSIAMASCIICFIISRHSPELVRSIDQDFAQIDIIMSFGIVAIGLACLFTLVLDEYNGAIAREGKEAQLKAEMRLEMMSIQLESVADLKRIRHDVRHHDALILEYAQNGDIDGLKRYIKQKMDSDEYYATRIYCMNAVVNNILTVYTRRAQKENINVTVTADVINNLNISEPDLVAVLANLFENAIHGTREQKEGPRNIEIDIHSKGDRLIIKCSNTCREDLQLINGYPAARLGTGISSILNAAGSYDGTVSYKLEDNVLTCMVIMAIPPKKV